MEKISTKDLAADQVTRLDRLTELQMNFPKHAPRGDRVAAMYKVLSEIDQVWVEFTKTDALLHIRDDIDGSHDYFKNKLNETATKIVTLIQDLANNHMLTITGVAGTYNLITRPDNYRTQPMINEDGSLKGGANPFGDNSIITMQTRPKNGNHTTNSGASSIDGTRTPLHQTVQDLMDSSTSRCTAGHSSLMLTLNSIDQLINDMDQMEETDPNYLVKGDIISGRLDTAKGIHDQLSFNTDYDPTGFFDTDARAKVAIRKAYRIENGNRNQRNENRNDQFIKMPTITMPTFNGEYTKWRGFRDLFIQMINSRRISDVEKFIYLKQNVTGECLALISHLQMTNDTYAVAWKILEARYENPRQILKATINQLFNIERAKPSCSNSIKRLHDLCNESINSIVQLAGSYENVMQMVFHQLILNKVDAETHAIYEQSLVDSTAPQKAEDILKFLVKRFQALEHSGAGRTNNQPQQKPQFPKWKRTTALAATTIPAKTTLKGCGCKDKHALFKCPKFLALTPQERSKKARDGGRCLNCLRDNHQTKDCKAEKCHECSRLHHSTLHFGSKKVTSLLTAAAPEDVQHVFLGTACIYIENSNGNFIPARALLDSGSQVSIITDKFLKKTGLKTQISSLEIFGMGQNSTRATERTVLNIASRHSNYRACLEVYVMKKVTSVQPNERVDVNDWNIPSDTQLADESFNIPAAVDIIIGGELFYQLMATGFQQLGKNLPDLQNTVFGWIVVGKMIGLEPTQAFAGMGIAQSNISLKNCLTKFWEIEERGTEEKVMNEIDLACEQFYADTTIRGSDGRYTVKLQFNGDPYQQIGRSLETATRRFFALEKKMAKDPNMKEQYVQFMEEYETLGHMEALENIPTGNKCYYIPHHAVLNPSSTTTKFRVVFDASAKTSTNTSLNELMATGPMLQDDLFTIMARFRTLQYVFSADITKMYRQILIAEEDQKWQLVLWRKNPTEVLKCYKLKTVTYGTKCASYLAIKTLQTLAKQEADKYPLAAKIATRDFNVDDIMSGSNDLQEALKMQHQITEMMNTAGMILHKWCANHQKLLANIPAHKREISLDISEDKEETKALGMRWIPRQDTFMLSYNPKPQNGFTKRTVLSETAQLFDPLGLVNPVIVKAKVFLQELWKLETDWDEPLPEELQRRWTNYRSELSALTGIQIPRHVNINDSTESELHIFSDASELSYGACVYVRSKNQRNEFESHFLCSKSRVAPVKKLSLPRLELCGAYVAVQLGIKLQHKLGMNISRITYWTDSAIVLAWIATQSPLKTFVANRVSKIKRETTVNDWRYVETKQNPADIVSRGCSTQELKNNSLWWNGPRFLIREKDTWPTTKPEFQQELAEVKKQKTMLMATVAEPSIMENINHRNSIVTWQRIVAYCLKFGTKQPTGEKDKATLGNLTKADLHRAMQSIIKYAQYGAFHDDIHALKNGNPEKTQFKTMTPIFDADGVLRVGGRLQSADLTFEQQHPAILPYNHEVTKLILQRLHLDNLHAGPQALLAAARQKYWIIKGKVMAKKIVDTCVLCCRAKPKLLEQVMGPLPKNRVTASRPFLTTGIDFAGPILIHQQGRGQKILKAYVCVFVCFATKAVHLEAAVDLSTEAFLRCLKRFIARRGIPTKCFSDNGTNLRGMNNQLLDLADQMNSPEFKEKLAKYCDNHHIEWKFIPPRSPHFGGLWEAAVKSAKHLLTRTIHNYHLTYDELSTVLTEIEAILNSRPISQMSDDPLDLQPLTAGHFLIGAPLTSINDSYIPNINKLQQWAKLSTIRKEFWVRWHKEYLHELQAKGKWRSGSPNIKIGTLVTIKDQNLAPMQWRMGRIESLIPDKEGIVRVVRVITQNGLFTRAIHELAPLPIEPLAPSTPMEKTQILENEIQKHNELEHSSMQTENQPTTNSLEPSKTKTKARKRKNVHFALIDETPRKTRSGKIFGINKNPSYFMMVILALALFIAGAAGKTCNTTQFTDNPGLYYESLGKVSLSNDEWKIICHLDLERYRKETRHLRDIVSHLKSTCPEIHPGDHCNIIIDQLSEQVDGINTRNELIDGFAEKTRTRRSANFFAAKSQRKNTARGQQPPNQYEDDHTTTELEDTMNQIQIQSIIAEMFGSIETQELKELSQQLQMEKSRKQIKRGGFNSIGKGMTDMFGTIETETLNKLSVQLQKQQTHKRVKRGWFDGIGKGAKTVFGILNVDDAEEYQKQILGVKENADYLKELIANQTTIQEITSNIIRRDEKKMDQVLQFLTDGAANFAGKDQVGKEHIFSTLSMQALHSIQRYEEMQASIINLLTMVFHGKIPPTLINPVQLRKQLAVVSSHIDHNLMVPGSDEHNYISQLYKLLSAKVHVTKDMLLVEIKVPLISRDYYQLYHIIPVPFVQNGQLKMISPSVTYIGINPKQDHYYLMKTEEKENCLIYSDDFLICKQQQPLHNVQANQTRCEMAVLMEPKQVHRSCKITDFIYAQSWTSLAQINHHMYAMQQETPISIICGAFTEHCSLMGTGIIEIEENCLIKSGILEISSKNQIDNQEELLLISPPVNITDHLPEHRETKNSGVIANWSDLKDNSAEWEVLQQALDQQKMNANHALPNNHDIHHYSLGYSSIAMMIIFILVIWQRKRIMACCRRPSPTPTQNRANGMITASSPAMLGDSIELQDIQIDNWHRGVRPNTDNRLYMPSLPPRNIPAVVTNQPIVVNN